MIVKIPSGIRGLDELIGGGAIPENTVTLVYGPPKVGKSIFSYGFTEGVLRGVNPVSIYPQTMVWRTLRGTCRFLVWMLRATWRMNFYM
ncbi:ATPase domain-containing protein [Methanothermobacter sp. KEPCO-1]|uniref:RAD55 family ATPase n=1 Tax=Methanothermobacter sp. KEPCO-1 TaxID=2603820 RepID=UPI0021036B5F|nr:ATPase domain-containing protein [Methanothermobacter sp. KEPCO-1]